LVREEVREDVCAEGAFELFGRDLLQRISADAASAALFTTISSRPRSLITTRDGSLADAFVSNIPGDRNRATAGFGYSAYVSFASAMFIQVEDRDIGPLLGKAPEPTARPMPLSPRK
jgi:hypothetical protein